MLMSAITFSCNSTSETNNENTGIDSLKSSDSTEQTVNENNEKEESAAALTLNNGAKWKADPSTNENVKSIKIVSDKFSGKKEKSLNEYHQCAADFQQAADKLIADCKMSGPDHDALHLWLHPLLEKIKTLKNSKDITEAGKFYSEIQSQLTLYKNFFD